MKARLTPGGTILCKTNGGLAIIHNLLRGTKTLMRRQSIQPIHFSLQVSFFNARAVRNWTSAEVCQTGSEGRPRMSKQAGERPRKWHRQRAEMIEPACGYEINIAEEMSSPQPD